MVFQPIEDVIRGVCGQVVTDEVGTPLGIADIG